MKSIIIFLFCVVVVMAVVGVAAGPSNPGDKLYGYKRGVNERISVWTHPTNESRGLAEVLLVERRFQELHKLFIKGNTDPVILAQATVALAENEQAVQKRFEKTAESGDILVAYHIYAQYESVFLAYSRYLSDKFPDRVTNFKFDSGKDTIEKRLVTLKGSIAQKYIKQQFVKGMEERFTEAGERVGAANTTLLANKNLLSTEQYDLIAAMIVDIKKKIQDGENKRSQEYYGDSFVFVADAHSLARQATILLQLYGAY